MATEIGIANTALARLGANAITSFTEGTKSANSANRFYEETRDDLLRSHEWNFATKRVELAQLSTAPAFGYDYAYGLPSDWLRTINAFDNDAGVGALDYREEYQDGQNVLVTSAVQVYLVYVALITDPNRMPPDFRKALSRSLAEAMSVELTSSNTLQQTVSAEARGLILRAKSADARGGAPRQLPKGTWASVRAGRVG